MKIVSLALLMITTTCFMAVPVWAQTDQAFERVERLEHDIQLLQKQVARGETVTSTDGGEPLTNTNQLEIRLTGIEDQIRDLRGNVERIQNDVRKVTESLDRFQKDTEFRLNQASAAPQDSAPSGAVASEATPAPSALPAPEGAQNPEPLVDQNTKKKPITLKTNFPSPRDHYNYAFRLLNQTQYEQAAVSFDDFVAKYPKDALAGNAYYWGGETYYIRRDYVKAADYFRQGYEVMPEGPKAADNLYKLALSLNALDRGKESCVVLQQVVAKFNKTSTNIAAKAEQEIKNSGCRSKP